MPLDPDVAAALEALPPAMDASLGLDAFLAANAGPRSWPVTQTETVVSWEERGPLRLYRPRRRPRRRGPGVLFLHGGGFVSGSPAPAEPAMRHVVERFGAVVASLTYRLAPADPYPAALDDTLAALHWLAARPDTLGFDPGRLVVMGFSAGATLAAAAALHARDHHGPPIALQVLGSPTLDDRLETPSSHEITDPRVWNRAMAALTWRAYLSGLPAGEATPPYAAPARAPDLSGLPPAVITVNDYDPTRDEGLDYARRLEAAGVPTEVHLFEGTFHGSLGYAPEAEVSRRELETLLSAVGRA